MPLPVGPCNNQILSPHITTCHVDEQNKHHKPVTMSFGSIALEIPVPVSAAPKIRGTVVQTSHVVLPKHTAHQITHVIITAGLL